MVLPVRSAGSASEANRAASTLRSMTISWVRLAATLVASGISNASRTRASRTRYVLTSRTRMAGLPGRAQPVPDPAYRLHQPGIAQLPPERGDVYLHRVRVALPGGLPH